MESGEDINGMEISAETPRDLFGNPITAPSSSSDNSEASNVDENETTEQQCFSRHKQSTMHWRKCSVATSLLRATVNEHRKRLLEGEEARRGLKEWSDRVLSSANNEAIMHSASFDIDQHELELDAPQRLSSRGSEGVGAELMSYWNRTVEERVAFRLLQARDEWDREQQEKSEELLWLRAEREKLMQDSQETAAKIAELESELWEATDVATIEQRESACQTEEDVMFRIQQLEEALEESLYATQNEKHRRLEAETEINSLKSRQQLRSEWMSVLGHKCASIDAQIESFQAGIQALPFLSCRCRHVFEKLTEALHELSSGCEEVRKRLGNVKEMFNRSWRAIGCQTDEMKREGRERSCVTPGSLSQALALLAEAPETVKNNPMELLKEAIQHFLSGNDAASPDENFVRDEERRKLAKIKAYISRMEESGWSDGVAADDTARHLSSPASRKAPLPPKRLKSTGTQTAATSAAETTQASHPSLHTSTKEAVQETSIQPVSADTNDDDMEFLRIQSMTLQERPWLHHSKRIARPFSAPLPWKYETKRSDAVWDWKSGGWHSSKISISTPQKGMRRRYLWQRPIRPKELTLPSWCRSPLAWRHFTGRYFKWTQQKREATS